MAGTCLASVSVRCHRDTEVMPSGCLSRGSSDMYFSTNTSTVLQQDHQFIKLAIDFLMFCRFRHREKSSPVLRNGLCEFVT